MNWDRFQLLRMLHFSDNFAFADQHKIYKVKTFSDMIIQKFQRIYTPGSEVVLDDSSTMIPFRGISFRQYIPGKSHKYGLKLSITNTADGYTWNCEVYCGKTDTFHGLGATDSLTARLMMPLFDLGMTLYCDNFYTSIPLAEYLLTQKTYLCGTVRTSCKGLSREVTKAKVKKGEVVSLQNDNGVKVFHGKDKRSVLTLTTVPEHDDTLIPTGKTTRNGEDITKPKCSCLQQS